MATRKETHFTDDMLTATMSNPNGLIAAARLAVNRHKDAISSELDTIQWNCSPLQRAKASLVFSIISPRCPFDKNVKVTRVLLHLIETSADVETMESAIRAHGIGLAPTKAKAVYDAADFIRNMRDSDINRESLLSIRGIAMKASAMTVALFDPTADVFTLDTHMLRGIAVINGFAPATYSISTARYRKLESWIVQTLKAEFSDVPTFLIQWSLWNEFGFNGIHQTHTAIFGL